MRIPKPHLSRKVLLIAGGLLVIGGGGTGAAAVFLGKDALLGPSYAELNGFACTEVQTVEVRKKDRFWVRKYVTTDEPADGIGRVKTALRVAKALQAEKKADLVQVVVLDKAGPTSRAQIRGRAVGADIIYIPDPSRVPEEASARHLTARYIDGNAAPNGQFFGERIDMIEADIDALVAKLDDQTDCLKPEIEVPEGEGHGAKADGHGKADAKDTHGEKPADGHGEKGDGGHGEKPADGHGEAKAEGHGEAPADGHGEEAPVAAHGAEEGKGWMASLMGMVGLGGDEAPAGDHAPEASEGHDAPANGHGEAPGDGHGAPPAADHAAAPVDQHQAGETEGHAAPAAKHEGPAEDHGADASEHAKATEEPATAADEAHGAKAEHAVEEQPADSETAKADDHAAPAEEHATGGEAAPAEEKGWFDGLKSMVGLGGDDEAAPDVAEMPEAKSEDAGPASEPIQGDDWLAKMRAAPIEGAEPGEAEATSEDADAPAEDEAILPPKAKAKSDEQAKADH